MICASLILVAILAKRAYAHSWLECSSYDSPSFDYQTLGNYDHARCSGYPRGFKRQFNEGFAQDTGYNWNHNDCARDQFNINDYTDQIPMAKYRPGQTIYLSHPSKNHVADTCTNPFIPSTSFVVKMSSKTGVDTFDISLKMVGGEHIKGNIDHLSYQRCYKFCDNPDKAHCLTAWVLPNDIPDGIYSFIWSWEFNPLEYYSNCFDAHISSSNVISSSTNSSASSSTSSSTPDDVAFPSTSGVPAPTPATTTLSTSKPTPVATESPDTSPPLTDSPDTTSPEIISSGSPSLSSPLIQIRSYVMNISGTINITIAEVVRSMRV